MPSDAICDSFAKFFDILLISALVHDVAALQSIPFMNVASTWADRDALSDEH